MKSSDHRTIFAVKLRGSRATQTAFDIFRLFGWLLGMTIFVLIVFGFIGGVIYELTLIVKEMTW